MASYPAQNPGAVTVEPFLQEDQVLSAKSQKRIETALSVQAGLQVNRPLIIPLRRLFTIAVLKLVEDPLGLNSVFFAVFLYIIYPTLCVTVWKSLHRRILQVRAILECVIEHVLSLFIKPLIVLKYR